MRTGRLLLLVLTAGPTIVCHRAARAPAAAQHAPNFMRLLEDAAASAGPDTVPACEAWQAAFMVEVLDSVTPKPAAWQATLTWRRGRTIETTAAAPKWPMPVEDMAAISGPPGRAATCDLLIRKLGYHDWYRPGVVVKGTPGNESGRCEVETVYLRALLRPERGTRRRTG